MIRKPCCWDTRQHGFSDTEARGYSGMTDKHIFGGHIQTSDDLKAFLNHAIRASVSDVFIQAGRRIHGQIHGRLVYLTRYAIQIDSMNQLQRLIIGNDEIRTALAGQRDYDTALTIPDETQTDEHGMPKNTGSDSTPLRCSTSVLRARRSFCGISRPSPRRLRTSAFPSN